MSTRSIYVTSPEGHTGKSSIALGLVDLLAGQVRRVGVFRPIMRAGEGDDTVLKLLLGHEAIDQTYAECVGVTYDDVHADPDAALNEIISRYRQTAANFDVMVIVGSDYTDVAGPTELAYNARIAANLGSVVVLVTSAWQRNGVEVRQVLDSAISELHAAHAPVIAAVANRAVPELIDEVREAVADLAIPAWVLPDVPLLSAPSVRQLMEAVDGELIGGDPELLDREAEDVIVGGMTMDHIVDRLTEGSVVIVPGDRSEAVLAVVAAHAAESYPSLAALILNGGYLPSKQISNLIDGLGQRLPMIATHHGTFETSRKVVETRGLLSTGSQRKIDLARSLFEAGVDGARLREAINVARSQVITPLMFEYDLIERAKADRKHIVLPEGNDDRILRATSTILARDAASITLLGDEAAIRARAAELGLDISGATVIDPKTSPWREDFAFEYAKLRAHKGVSLDRAREVVSDVSYFGTLMVHFDYADGMVSGAAHTTAHTISPAFQIIKTVPGTSIVSSVFFMCLTDRVLVYGDCAVNPDPNADQLADIALSSAQTAEQFGVDPRVAMLSYSTGASGAGAEVDKVRRATDMVKQRADGFEVEGPIQYDAAVDASVAATKLPGSQVAGKATVFIFPDLNTGNNTYKAVQRSAGAVAIGPVLQGLRKPINDLSRGSLVQDIVNTVAITAIQAQGVSA